MSQQESDVSLYIPALDAIKDFIKTSTSSMTAVPKPLKFLRPHFEDLTKCFGRWADGNEKVGLVNHYLAANTYSRVLDRPSRCSFCAWHDPGRRGETRNSQLPPSCALGRSGLLGSRICSSFGTRNWARLPEENDGRRESTRFD